MHFSTIFATLTLMLVTVVHANPTPIVHEDVRVCGMLSKACTDQSPTEMCKFKGIKDSQGECYTRGEGPPSPDYPKEAPPCLPH